ncbi:MAG TPA: RluA family pseudouridine synthase [Candidatus Polarisedimenticolaceae bacterium]|nr:RluA family pseudouridine synthase [Candidatus Polarisedimenticolaceae bacterium]
MKKSFRSEEAEAGRTVQRLLHDRLGLSNAEAKGLIASGCVRRNRRVVTKPDERAVAGDQIEVTAEPGRKYAGADKTLRVEEGYRVVHEDDDLVVVDKEAGVVTVPAGPAAGESLQELLLAAYKRRGHKRPQLHVVHRIDRYTSGLVVFARTHPAYMELKSQFKARTPERIYLAVASGRVEPDRGRLVHTLAEHEKSLKVHVVPQGPQGRLASLSYKVVERLPDATLLEVRLETGRRNQIRVQLAATGHALIGDVTYGEPSPLLARTALHAHRLTFEAPRGHKPMRFESPVPGDIRRLLRKLRSYAEKSTSTPV